MCNTCRSADVREYQKENRVAEAARNAKYYQTNIEKCKLSRAKYRAENKEITALRNKEWYLANKQRAAAYGARHYREHKEKYAAQNAEWYLINRDKKYEYKRNRRARKANSTGHHTAVDVREKLALQGYKCTYCGADITERYHIDHIMPLALGGSNDRGNIQMLCPTCNLRKAAKHPDVYAKECQELHNALNYV